MGACRGRGRRAAAAGTGGAGGRGGGARSAGSESARRARRTRARASTPVLLRERLRVRLPRDAPGGCRRCSRRLHAVVALGVVRGGDDGTPVARPVTRERARRERAAAKHRGREQGAVRAGGRCRTRTRSRAVGGRRGAGVRLRGGVRSSRRPSRPGVRVRREAGAASSAPKASIGNAAGRDGRRSSSNSVAGWRSARLRVFRARSETRHALTRIKPARLATRRPSILQPRARLAARARARRWPPLPFPPCPSRAAVPSPPRGVLSPIRPDIVNACHRPQQEQPPGVRRLEGGRPPDRGRVLGRGRAARIPRVPGGGTARSRGAFGRDAPRRPHVRAHEGAHPTRHRATAARARAKKRAPRTLGPRRPARSRRARANPPRPRRDGVLARPRPRPDRRRAAIRVARVGRPGAGRDAPPSGIIIPTGPRRASRPSWGFPPTASASADPGPQRLPSPPLSLSLGDPAQAAPPRTCRSAKTRYAVPSALAACRVPLHHVRANGQRRWSPTSSPPWSSTTPPSPRRRRRRRSSFSSPSARTPTSRRSRPPGPAHSIREKREQPPLRPEVAPSGYAERRTAARGGCATSPERRALLRGPPRSAHARARRPPRPVHHLDQGRVREARLHLRHQVDGVEREEGVEASDEHHGDARLVARDQLRRDPVRGQRAQGGKDARARAPEAQPAQEQGRDGDGSSRTPRWRRRSRAKAEAERRRRRRRRKPRGARSAIGQKYISAAAARGVQIR